MAQKRAFTQNKRGAIVAGSAVALTTLALAAAAMWSKPALPETTASYGEILLARGDYQAAGDTLRAEYRAKPTPHSKRILVDALFGANDPGAALALLRQSDGVELPLLEAHALRAEALLRLEQPDEASEEISPLETVAPGVVALVRARTAFAKGDGAAADAALADAVRAGGDTAQSAWLLRARYALTRNDFSAAGAAALRAEECGAPRPAVLALQIESAIRAGDFKRAHALIGPERKTPRGETENAYLRMLLDAAEGRYESASIRLRMIEPALSREPRGRLVAAFIREGAGDLAQAEIQFRRAASSAPRDEIAQDALVAFLVRRGKFEEASYAAESLGEIAPEAARLRRAQALAASGAFDAAFSQLTQGPSKLLKPQAAILGARAPLFGAEGSSEARAEYYAAASAALLTGGANAPSPPRDAALDPVALSLSGEIALQAGDATHAQQNFAAAVDAAPTFARAVAGEARAALRTAGFAAARRVVLQAHARAPGDFELRLHAARVRQSQGAAKDALGLLAPVIEQVMISPEAVTLYADLVVGSGDSTLISALADAMQRQGSLNQSAIRVYLKSGRLGEAVSVAERMLARGAMSAESTAFCLETLAADRDADGAHRALIAALARRRPDDAPLQAAATILARSEGFAAAAEAARIAEPESPQALRIDYLQAPSSPVAAQRYALSLLAMGQTRSGSAILAEACFWGAQAACPAASGKPGLRKND